MNFHKEKLLTIITESYLEEHLVRDINKLGAKGYTITSVKGKGERGIRNNLWSASSNIKIEIICEEKVCKKIIEFVKANHIKNYAMILYFSEVSVLKH
ncbi:transcriptional regulator [Candidatus Dependentiae bacterium]|nr:transcriptional regulator [Candidatus Dependentiae bacterium]